MESTTFLEAYRRRDCVRHFDAITTRNNHWVGKAIEKVNEEMGGSFAGLLELYKGRSTEDLAKDLGVSYEIADDIRDVTGMA